MKIKSKNVAVFLKQHFKGGGKLPGWYTAYEVEQAVSLAEEEMRERALKALHYALNRNCDYYLIGLEDDFVDALDNTKN